MPQGDMNSIIDCVRSNEYMYVGSTRHSQTATIWVQFFVHSTSWYFSGLLSIFKRIWFVFQTLQTVPQLFFTVPLADSENICRVPYSKWNFAFLWRTLFCRNGATDFMSTSRFVRKLVEKYVCSWSWNRNQRLVTPCAWNESWFGPAALWNKWLN